MVRPPPVDEDDDVLSLADGVLPPRNDVLFPRDVVLPPPDVVLPPPNQLLWLRERKMDNGNEMIKKWDR